MKSINWQDKKIAILGCGIENQALLFWLLEHGATDITICDKSTKFKCQISNKIQSSNLKKGIIVRAKQSGVENSKAKLLHRTSFESKNIKFQLGKDYLKDLDKFDLVFRTPGIPFQNPEIQSAIRKGVEVSSQMKLFFDLCPAKIIGVTGTKGKGTTTTLIYEILKRVQNDKSEIRNPKSETNSNSQNSKQNHKSEILNLKSKIYLGGNIGNPPIEFLDKLTKDDWVVLELSSFQLQDLNISPHIAVILDITSDHLDHHKNTKEYIDAKINIVRYQNISDFTVINLDYLTSYKFASISPTKNDYYFSTSKSVDLGTFVLGDKILLRVPVIPDRKVARATAPGRESNNKLDSRFHGNDSYYEYVVCKTSEVKLVGRHNLENICAAVTASFLSGASIESIRKTINSYRGLEHRLELVREYKGVKFYNDSASTNPFTTIAAIKSFSNPIILIAGGSDKGADYLELGKVIGESKNIKKVVLIGETARKIKKTIKQYNNITIEQFGNKFDEAIDSAVKSAEKGNVVILSPASASFDMFENYEERGNEFKKIVGNIK